jgi:hypothetical protein
VRRLAFLVLLALALTARPSPAADEPPVIEVSDAAVAKLEKAAPLLGEAERAFASKDWDDSIAKYAKALEALGTGDEDALGGWRDQALYNTACAHARAGRGDEAAECFARSVANGLRLVIARDPGGRYVGAPGLTLEHVLADADLNPIRTNAKYLAALKPFLAAGEPLVEFTQPETSSPVPAVIVLAAEGDDPERALPAWRVAAKESGRALALVALAGPIRANPKERRWILGDGDERWAVAKVQEALDLVAKDPRIDPKRVFVAAAGQRPGEAAWAAVLADPAKFAGLAALGGRFHAAWHADAIAAAPKTWRVALGAKDDEPAKMLKASGIEAVRVEASKDESKTVGAILDALLGKP